MRERKDKKNLFNFFIFNFKADSTSGIPSSNAVLLIYSSYGTYSTQIKNDYASYLTSTGAVVDEVVVAQGSGPGFYDELIAQQGSKVIDPNNPLKYWYQVWDLRFTDLYSFYGVGFPVVLQIQKK